MIAFAVVLALLIFEAQVLNRDVQKLKSQIKSLMTENELNKKKLERLELLSKMIIGYTGIEGLIRVSLEKRNNDDKEI